jgi:hypothetical protein
MKTYFYRIGKDDTWFRVTIDGEIDWNRWISCEEAVELLPDGSGMYRRCKEMPMKEDFFLKLPETMTMIALKSQTVTFYMN